MPTTERDELLLALVEAEAIADVEFASGVSSVRPAQGPGGAAPQITARMEPPKGVARAAGDARIDGRRLAAVVLALPVGEPVGVGADDVEALIRRAAVHEHDLDARIRLPKDAL